ncbi:MAG: hypothetical protein GY943_33020 [Chloroflexi bacterium]|nr:hypothetical protein [Chloroflexota bacterium]
MKQQRSTVWRIVTSDSSSIEDYKNFPAHTLTASDAPFYFTESADESVPEMVEVNGRFPHTILAGG